MLKNDTWKIFKITSATQVQRKNVYDSCVDIPSMDEDIFEKISKRISSGASDVFNRHRASSREAPSVMSILQLDSI